MLIGNKKVSQLQNLTPSEVQSNDLFLIIDTSVKESKNIETSQLASWLNVSGSLYAIHAITADTASYVLGGNVFGPVATAVLASTAISSSWADRSGNADQATSASSAITASFAMNASGLSDTSSYLLYQGFPNGTASYALNAGIVELASSAAFLMYNGNPNGTASHAISADTTAFCENANTASYFNNIGTSIASASWSDKSGLADNAVTASYAQVARAFAVPSMYSYGMFQSNAIDPTGSVLDNLIVNPSNGLSAQTLIQCVGSATINWTASITESMINNPYLILVLVNRFTSQIQPIDFGCRINFNVTPFQNTYGSLATGSMTIPFTLTDQLSLDGEYMMQLVPSETSSLQLDVGRSVRFIVSSYSDVVYTQFDVPMILDIQPSTSVLISFSSSANSPLGGGAGAYQDYLPGVLATGSQHITAIDISNQSVDYVKFTWTCTSMSYFNCENNMNITNLDYSFASTLQTLIADNCNITEVGDMSFLVSASHIDLSNNQIDLLPVFPFFTLQPVYINLSTNRLGSLPLTLPFSMSTILANNNILSGTLGPLPDFVSTASFNTNPFTDMTNLPVSLSYLDVSYTSMSVFPSSLPVSTSYLNVTSASFDIPGLVTFTNDLVANNYPSGVLVIYSYGVPTDIGLVANITALQANGWTVLFDT